MISLSNPLEEYLWKNRVVVTFSPSKNDTQRKEFLNNYDKYFCEVNARNIVHIDLIFDKKNHEIENFKSFIENLSLSSSEFHLILFGKDGGIKLKSRKTSLEELFSLIDTMPMRKKEMLNDKC